MDACVQAPATISNDGVGENSRPLPPLASKGCRLLQLCGLVMPATEATSLEYAPDSSLVLT